MVIHDILSGYETWCFILQDRQRLKVFENRVLKRTLGPNLGKERGARRNGEM
jgi:hypothetical protein